MKMHEINNMTYEEIERELEDLLEAYSNLKFQQATHQLDNPVKLKYIRKDIARTKTVLREFDMGIRKSKNIAEKKPKAESITEEK